MSDYTDRLKDPRWQKRRLEIMQRDGFRCFICESGTETLNVHHKLYLPQHDSWEYMDEQLVTLCEADHKAIHSVWPNGVATFRSVDLFKSVSSIHSLFVSFLNDERLLPLYAQRNQLIQMMATTANVEAAILVENDLDNVRNKIRQIERELALTFVRRIRRCDEASGWPIVAKFWGLA